MTAATFHVSRFAFHEKWARALTGLLLLLAACAASAADIWYEDNNLGRAGGMPADFVEKFRQPDSFRQASSHIRVYMVRANVLDQMDDQFFTALLLPYLRENNIRLAIDAGGATLTQMNARAQVSARDINLLKRLSRLGAEVHHVSLQSVLSKPPRGASEDADYPMSKRIADVVAFSRAVRSVFPHAEIGLIDALPSHGKNYRQPYRWVRDALAREGMALSYIHLDISFEAPKAARRGVTWHTIRDIERYVEDDLGLNFGLFAKSRNGGYTSSRAFHERVMGVLDCYSGVSGTPRDFIIASWFPHPARTIPEYATGDDYPAMRTVLEFGRKLRQVETAGEQWAAQRAREPQWRAQCGVGAAN
jgi:hypothetical protein